MKITWTQVLIGSVVLLLGIVGYFLIGQNDKLNVIYSNTLTLPEDVKKIKETELPNIAKRLEDHQALLVALASARGGSAGPEYEKLLENLLKRILKAELDKTNAAIAKLENGQSGFHKDLTRLSQLIDRQSKLAVASPFAAFLSPERLRALKAGDTITVPASPSVTYFVTSPRDFSAVARDITETYKGLGLEVSTVAPKAPAPEAAPRK